MVASGGVFARAGLAEKSLEGIPDVFFFLNLHGLKIGFLDLREKRDHAAAVIARAERLDLAIAEEVGHLGQLVRGLERRFVVGFEVVAVRAVEHIHVPQGGVVTLLDDLQRLVVAGGDERAAGFALVKKLLLGASAPSGVVPNENAPDVLVARKLSEE